MENQPTTEEVLQGTPDPEMIKQQVEARARIDQTSMALGFLVQQIQGVIGMLTNNNPRLALAISNELSLCYSEAMRRGLQIVDKTQQPPQEANAPQAASLSGTPDDAVGPMSGEA